jgi:threonine dehydrogenase-like Zn-dependent dehydrogenase
MLKLERHMMRIFSLEFWSYAGERAIKTVAQSAIAVLGTGSIGLFAIDWVSLASVSLGAGLLSILTSVAFKKD